MERESLLSRQQKKKTLGCSHGMSWLCEATSMEMVTFHVFFSAQNWVWLKFSVQRRHPLAIKHGNWQSPMNKGFHMPYMGKSFELPMDAFQMPCRFTGGKKNTAALFLPDPWHRQISQAVPHEQRPIGGCHPFGWVPFEKRHWWRSWHWF